MKTYDKYKSSGIDWIGDIPEHWELKRLKFFAKVNSSISSFEIDKSSDDEVVFLPMEKVSEGGEINQELRKQINEVNSGLTYFEKGDVILAKITPCFENGKGALLNNLETNFGFGSTEFHTLRAIETVSTKLLFYITKSHSFRTLGEAFMSGSAGQKRVSTDFVKDFPIAFPSLDEQTAIAEYLDEKTAQTDKLIDEKRRLIELLKEERLGVINKAVTRGINPHAKLKPSGIAWLGDIPEHWEVKKLKYLVSKVGSGITPSGGANVYLEEGIPLLRSQNIYNEGLVLDDVAFISEEIDEQMSNSRVKDNDVLLNITGASIGRCCYIPKDFGHGNVNQHVCIIRPIPSAIETKYLHAFLVSGIGQNLVDSCQTGANREGLNFQQIKSFEIPISNVNEQKQIVEFIEIAAAKIDATIAQIEKEIGFLREYRTALISEVVTGKIKVTDN